MIQNFYNGTNVDDCRSMQKLEMPNSPRFLKVVELAELLKVKPRTIDEMVAQNRILIESHQVQTFFGLISTRAH